MNRTQVENTFKDELQGLLTLGSHQFKRLSKEGINKESLREVFFVIHNVKGLAAFLGNKEIAKLSHKLESLLLSIDKEIEDEHCQKTLSFISRYEDLLHHICSAEIEDENLKKQVRELSSHIQKETSSKKGLKLLDWNFDFENLEFDKKKSIRKRNILELTPLLENSSRKFREKINLISNLKSIEIEENSFNLLKKSLVHIIQNIYDHGFINGSNLINKVDIAASLKEGNLVLEIRDNGVGFNLSRIQKIALEKKLISKESKLRENEILNLVFSEGFSTKEIVTHSSGRGVGLSIVKADLEALGGSVEIATKEGLGSEFRLIIPLTQKVPFVEKNDAAA